MIPNHKELSEYNDAAFLQSKLKEIDDKIEKINESAENDLEESETTNLKSSHVTNL